MMLFHGGVPGLRPGDVIVPHERNRVDGCPICEAAKAGLVVIAPDGSIINPPTGEPDRVYVTSDRDYARFYASKYPRGDLYTVDVDTAELTPSTEDPFPTWTTPSATVRGIYSRYCELTPPQRRALLRRWAAVDAKRRTT